MVLRNTPSRPPVSGRGGSRALVEVPAEELGIIEQALKRALPRRKQ